MKDYGITLGRTSAALLLVALLGCNSKNSLTGAVTYDGQPIENGAITFTPADGKGPSAGGAISGGNYQIEDVPPGEKIVQVTAFGEVAVVRTTEELAQAAQSGGGQQPPPAKLVPEDAVGNNARVQITAGQGRLDIQLTPPTAN